MDSVNRGSQAPDPSEYQPADEDGSASFLGGLPSEVMKLIVDQLPIDDITHLAASDHAMWQTYTARSAQVPYALIGALREAVQSDYDVDKTLAALRAMKTEPLMSQPQLMRALAERAHGLAKISPGMT